MNLDQLAMMAAGLHELPEVSPAYVISARQEALLSDGERRDLDHLLGIGAIVRERHLGVESHP